MTDDGQTEISSDDSKEDAAAPDDSGGQATCDAVAVDGAEPINDSAVSDGGRANGISGEVPVSRDHAPRSNGNDRAAARATKPQANNSPTALQDMFLNGLRRENIDVVVYLCDGTQERGAVRGFDTFTILLENRNSGKSQLIYKHAVARIFPTRSPAMHYGGDRAKK